MNGVAHLDMSLLPTARGQLVQQLTRRYIETPCDPQDGRQPGLARPALETADGGGMNVGLVGQGILGQTVLGSQLAQTPSECNARGVGILVEMVHPRMLDAGCQPVQSDLVGSALVYYAVGQSRLDRPMAKHNSSKDTRPWGPADQSAT